MLADVYGPQRLLHDGLLPPALVFGHPGYLRPLHGVEPPGGLHLHIAAFDLARGADGALVGGVAAHAGASGLGYVLENRLIISRLFPEAFRELRVQHLASGYRRLLDTLQQRPRTGARRATAHAAHRAADARPLQRDLLRARLPGALPRPDAGRRQRPDGARRAPVPQDPGGPGAGARRCCAASTTTSATRWSCAPTRRSACPACCRSMRAGNVVLANAPGTGFLESPALLGFLPASARRLLGEELRCRRCPPGGAARRRPGAAVRGDLDGTRRAHRPSRQRRRSHAAIGAARRRATLAGRIDADPDAHTVQGYLPPSQAPLPLAGGALTAAPGAAARLRGRRCRARPLARAARRPDAHRQRAPTSLSMQRGGSSADTWVLTDGAVDTFSMLPQRLRSTTSRRAAAPWPAAPREPVLARPLHRARRAARCAWRVPRST